MASIVGIHHVKFPVSDLAASRAWYERLFGLQVRMEFRDESGGPVRGVSYEPIAGVCIELREHPVAARGLAGFDPVSFAIEDRAAAESWVVRLDELGVAHSPIIEATVGWLVSFEDPDGTELHLYSVQPHGVDHAGEPGYGTRVGDQKGRFRHFR